MSSTTERPTANGSAEPQGKHELGDRLRRLLVTNRLPPPTNPVLLKHVEERATDVQARVADRITDFAGSMQFVYLHIVWFGLWIGLGVEKFPYGLLTMIVSLEAIFLSTFVMISQNRADAKRQVLADQQWHTVQEEDHQNQELLELSQQILKLTKEVRAYADTVAEESDQNKELLGLSKELLVLTKDVQSRFAAEGLSHSNPCGDG